MKITGVIGVHLRVVFHRQGGNVGVRGQVRSGSGDGQVPFQVFQMALPGVERSGMGAADYASYGWGGGLLALESVVQRTAPFGDGAGGALDDVAIGAAQSGVAAAGEAGDGVDGTQPAGAAARAGAAQLNRLKRNATSSQREDAPPQDRHQWRQNPATTRSPARAENTLGRAI